MQTEVEIRSFITDEEYDHLLIYFQREATFLSEDHQETHYLSGEHDLRLQKSNRDAKVWLKKGAMHDESREELEVHCAKEDFETLKQLFATLGYETAIIWLRHRYTFLWDNITVTLDDTKGYGKILELEQLVGEDEQDTALANLKTQLADLKIPLTPKEEFAQKFADYKKNWRTLII